MASDDRPLLDVSGYDFLDIGASMGGSIQFAQEHLRGGRGLGIDINPAKVRKSIEAGYDCVEADAANLELPDNSVRFVIVSHLLEHLPDLETCKRIIANASRVASDFIYLQGPYFDADDYLEGLGFKFFYSDWSGHTCHLTARALHGILLNLELTEHAMLVVSPTVNSSDPFIHPLDSPFNQQKYDASKHPPKSKVVFKQPVYKEFVCYVKLRNIDYWDELVRSKPTAIPLDQRLLPIQVEGQP